MINGYHEFQLNGVNYRAKHTGDQEPMIEEFDPLRPQNAQLVQGEDTAVFNMRPDVLVFKWTDWSGGEGQFNFDPQAPARYYQGQAIDAYTVPGTLRAGPAINILGLHASPGTPLEITSTYAFLRRWQQNVYMVANNAVYGIAPGFDGWFLEQASITGRTGEIQGVTADTRWLWMMDDNSIIRLDGAGTFVDFATGVTTANGTLVNLGDYIYVVRATNLAVNVDEWVKSDAPPATGTNVFSSSQSHDNNIAHMEQLTAVSPNRLYVAVSDQGKTFIIEITPTTAAAAGFGALVGMIPVEAASMAWSAGLLFLHCFADGQPITTRTRDNGQLVYFNPTDGTYGLVDSMSPGRAILASGNLPTSTQKGGTGLTESFIGLRSGVTGVDEPSYTRLVVHDAVNGALHGFGYQLPYTPTGGYPYNIVRHQQHIYMSLFDALATDTVTSRCKPGVYEGDDIDPYAISSAWDFGLVDDKILSSLRVACDPVPTNWSIKVDYQLDESGSWTNAGTVAATEDGGTFAITSSAATKNFRLMRLRVRFLWLGTGDPTTTPVLTAVEARAQVTQKLRSWNLMLECQDDQAQAQGQSFTGAQKIANIKAIAASGAGAISFKNGMINRRPNQFETISVLVDSARVYEVKPGEGFAQVRLVEVA